MAASVPEIAAVPEEQQGATAAENARFGVWLWLASDCALFAALFATYFTLRGATGTGPGPGQLFDLRVTATMTFILLASSATMGLALDAVQRGEVRPLRLWLAVTMLLGAGFVGLQVAEFTSYVHHGLTLAGSDFGASFFVLVGFHGLHVSWGVAWLLSLLVYTWRKPGGIGPGDVWRVETASLYWYFVDVVWVVIFTAVYLIGKA